MSVHVGETSGFVGSASRLCEAHRRSGIALLSPAAVPVLSTRFSFEEPALWFARARLLDDAIELTGWRLTGRYQRRIPLHTIVEIDAPTSDCLLLWFTTGRTLRLRLDDAARWKRAIETRRRDADAS
jgi:hypothetical protein